MGLYVNERETAGRRPRCVWSRLHPPARVRENKNQQGENSNNQLDSELRECVPNFGIRHESNVVEPRPRHAADGPPSVGLGSTPPGYRDVRRASPIPTRKDGALVLMEMLGESERSFALRACAAKFLSPQLPNMRPTARVQLLLRALARSEGPRRCARPRTCARVYVI